MSKIFLLLSGLLAVTSASLPPAYYGHNAHYVPHAVPQPLPYTVPLQLKETPKPYSFAYAAPSEGGGSTRQETSDSSGRVTGSYSLADADGRTRIVEYYADETGFHANVKTNEPGTDNQSPADVSVQSSAPVVVHPEVPKAEAVVVPSVNQVVPVTYSVISNAIPYTGYYGNDHQYGGYYPNGHYYPSHYNGHGSPYKYYYY